MKKNILKTVIASVVLLTTASAVFAAKKPNVDTTRVINDLGKRWNSKSAMLSDIPAGFDYKAALKDCYAGSDDETIDFYFGDETGRLTAVMYCLKTAIENNEIPNSEFLGFHFPDFDGDKRVGDAGTIKTGVLIDGQTLICHVMISMRGLGKNAKLMYRVTGDKDGVVTAAEGSTNISKFVSDSKYDAYLTTVNDATAAYLGETVKKAIAKYVK